MKRYACEKGNIEGREGGYRQSLYRGTKNFLQRRWKTYTRFLTSFSTTFSSLNYAQDFGNWVKESLKITTNSRWATFTKCLIVTCRAKYFHAFVSTLNYVSPIFAHGDKRRRSWDGGGLNSEHSTSLTTNYKKRINLRQSGIFTTSVTGLCHAICYLFKLS